MSHTLYILMLTLLSVGIPTCTIHWTLKKAAIPENRSCAGVFISTVLITLLLLGLAFMYQHHPEEKMAMATIVIAAYGWVTILIEFWRGTFCNFR